MDNPFYFIDTVSGIKFIDNRLTGTEYGDNAMAMLENVVHKSIQTGLSYETMIISIADEQISPARLTR